MSDQPPGDVQVLHNLHGALHLLIRGAAHELTEQHNVPQPEADIKVLHALFIELDAQADLPTMLISPVLDAIRISVKNVHAYGVSVEEETATIRARLQEPQS